MLQHRPDARSGATPIEPVSIPLGTGPRNELEPIPVTATDRATVALECIATLLATADFTRAATALVSELAVRFRCDRVTLACMQDGTLRITAVSHRADLSKHSTLHQDIVTAMEEALAQAALIAYPPPDASKPRITLAHQVLASHHGTTALCSVPLMREGTVLGVLTFEGTEPALFDAPTRAHLEQIAGLIAPVIEIRRRDARGGWERLRDDFHRAAGRLFGPSDLSMKFAIALAIGLGAGLALYPIEVRVTANARVEGLVQRAVVAPADGFLKSALVRPGDAVAAGATLRLAAGR